MVDGVVDLIRAQHYRDGQSVVAKSLGTEIEIVIIEGMQRI